jgi:alkaline phosphatase D
MRSMRWLVALAFDLGCQSSAPHVPDQHTQDPTPETEGVEALASAKAPVTPTARQALGPPSLPVPSGLAVGEVTDTAARVWSRCAMDARLHAQVSAASLISHESTLVTREHDLAASLTFTSLTPGQEHRALVWCSEVDDTSSTPRSGAVEGDFSTAPKRDSAEAVRFAWGGDLGGQNVCRDAQEGYPIFGPMRDGDYAFFIALGDMIYADSPCRAVGAWGNAQIPRESAFATTLEGFHAAWRYNREDAAYRAFLASTPYYGVWDDHEVTNDFGPKTDLRRDKPYRAGEHLMPMGLQAMLDYNPFPEGDRLYRSHRWGQHVELFFLDTRRYRDDNTLRDSDSSPKRMLGEEQTRWLLDGLGRSDATWKFVISSVPLSIPTGIHARARDGFANYDGPSGFERELLALLAAMRERDVGHTVWLTTDVHMAAGFSYIPFPDYPDFVLHEFVAGPLSAGFFPRKAYDPTLHPTRLFTWGLDNIEHAKSYPTAKELLNYGDVRIDAQGRLSVGIRNAFGTEVRSVEVLPTNP